MPAPATIDEFLDLVRKSGVVEEARLSSYVSQLQQDPETPSDPSKYSGLMVPADGLLTFFQAEQFLQGKWKRFNIGKYKVLERLGSGGMGQVFLCEHKLMRRKVALKVLPTAKAEDPSSLERFYREARAVAALDHPNIVRAYDIDQEDNLHFLVMEYVDGSSLQELIKKSGPLDPIRACHYIYWSAVGLQVAHETGLIHRDIKPGNILVDRLGTVKILDLGLARFFNDEEDLLTKKYDENVLGTADYLAPEQALDSHGVDGRADIYSLGATFYFLLAGHQPFTEGTIAQKLLWHQNRQPKALKNIRPDIPEEIIQVVSTMMAKAPEERYQTPAEVAAALYPFIQTPIEPPSEKEMPTLSAAALSVGNSPTVMNRVTMQGFKIPVFQAHQPQAQNTPRPTKSHSDVLSVADAKNLPQPVVEPIPESKEVWSGIDAATHPTLTDVEPETKKKNRETVEAIRKPKRKPASRHDEQEEEVKKERNPKSKKTGSMMMVLVLGILLLGASAYALWQFVLRDNKPRIDTPREPDLSKLIVTRNPAEGQFSSIRAAVEQARPGTHIILQDDVWEEELTLSRVPQNLVIESASGKVVTWKALSSSVIAKKIIELGNCEAVTITGIKFVGENRSETAIRVYGKSAGVVLEDCQFEDFTGSFVNLADIAAEKAKPVSVHHCRFVQSAKEPTGYGVGMFTTQIKPGQTNINRCISVQDCRFEGLFNACIQVKGSTEEVDIKGNRMWKAAVGVNFTPSLPDYAYHMRITGNTLHQLTVAGIRFERAVELLRPQHLSMQRMFVQNNYFHTVPVLSTAEPNLPPLTFIVASDNARLASSLEGNPVLNCIVADAPLGIDPANGKTFLRYDKANPLAKAAKGQPIGVPPQ